VTPAVIWAMGCETLRQCLRRKVLFVLVLFVGMVLVGIQLIPSYDPVKRLGLVIALCLFCIALLGAIVTVFLSATVLPEDRERKTITTVLTKPVGRLNYLLGRVLGFALTLGLILLVMGAASLGFIRWEGVGVGRTTGRTDLLVGRRGIDPTGTYLTGGKPTDRDGADARGGVLRGSIERRLVFGFRSELERLSGDNQTCEMTPVVWTSTALPTAHVEVAVTNPVTAEHMLSYVTFDSGRTVSVRFPKKLIDPQQGVEVSVRRVQAGSDVRFTLGSIQLLLRPVPFEYSFFKALAMIFFGLLVLVVVSIAASTFLSSWVAVLVGLVACLFAAIQDVMLDFMRGLLGESVGLLGAEAFRGHVHGPVAAAQPDSLAVVIVNKVFYGCMWVVTHAFPNVDHFYASSYLADLRDVPGSLVWTSGYLFLIYGACYLGAGHFIFWRREIAS
jgi:hypothetical protein